MKLWLAPMEGVVDFILRDYLSHIGGVDHFVTEFIRVTDKVLPDSVFHRYCPELKTECKTATGIPVTVQLLGSSPEMLAANAGRAVELGAQSIDLNFGCPAKTVNRHDGGAVLLKSPDRLRHIVDTVRKQVPAHIPVSAKMRLGFDSPMVCLDNAKAIADGGASFITVHCRTKTDMYKPPAYWEWIPRIRSVVSIPIIANGDIWNAQDLQRCQSETGCDWFMIGRGALRDPFVFLKVRGIKPDSQFVTPQDVHRFFIASQSLESPAFALARTKQLLRNMIGVSDEFRNLFDVVKTFEKPALMEQYLTERA